MTLIYMKPAIQAECGICGDYTRRAQPWPYSESGGPDSVALMTPVDEQCFSKIDSHVKYVKTDPTSDLVFSAWADTSDGHGKFPFCYEQFDDGRVIIQQGHIGMSFYFIISGKVTVRISEKCPNTGTQIIAYL